MSERSISSSVYRRQAAGKLNGAVIDNGIGMPCSRVYQNRFGSLLEVYHRIGYVPTQDFSYLAITEAMQVRHRERTAKLMTDFESMGATVHRDVATDLITINDELRAWEVRKQQYA